MEDEEHASRTLTREELYELVWSKSMDQLDSLKHAPRSMEFPKPEGHFANDVEQMKDAFGRLLGGEWQHAWKLGADYGPDPERHYFYERSVFELASADQADDEQVRGSVKDVFVRRRFRLQR